MKKMHLKNQLKKMGILACVLAFLLLFSIKLNAQGPGTFTAGGQVGITSSTLTNDIHNYYGSERKLGFAIGGYARYQALPFLGASAEVLYAQEGAANISPYLIYYEASLSSLNDIRKINSNVTLHNLEVPILVNIFVPGFDNDVEPRVFVGSSFDFILKAVAKDLVADQSGYYDEPDIVLSERSKDDVTSSFEYFNIGLVLGTGFSFYGGDVGMSIDIRYKIGLRDINNLGTLNYDNSYYPPEFSNNCLMVMMGVGLP